MTDKEYGQYLKKEREEYMEYHMFILKDGYARNLRDTEYGKWMSWLTLMGLAETFIIT